MKLLKRLLWLVGILLVLAVLALVVLYFYLGTVVKTGIEKAGPLVLKAPVTVEAVHVRPLAGTAQIRGLVVGNPEGFKTDSAFKLAEVRVSLVPRSLFSDRIVIREVFIDAPEITYEQGLRGSNLQALQQNAASAAGGTGEKPTAESEEPKAPGKKIQIDVFTLSHAKVSVATTLLAGQQVGVALPEVVVRDIGKDQEGASPAEVFAKVLEAIVQAVTDTVGSGKAVLGDTVEGAKDTGGKLLEGVKDVFRRK